MYGISTFIYAFMPSLRLVCHSAGIRYRFNSGKHCFSAVVDVKHARFARAISRRLSGYAAEFAVTC